jgi:uncharacterized protein YkwD
MVRKTYGLSRLWRMLLFFVPVLIAALAGGSVQASREGSQWTEILRPETIEEHLFAELNEEREKRGLPRLRLSSDLVLIPEADEIASSYSKTRSGGHVVEVKPEFLGLATVNFVIGPELEELAGRLAARASTAAPAGGVGSWFGRTREYPGGAYYVCMILLDENPLLELRSSQLTKAVLEAANGARRALGHKPLVLDSAMSKLAENYLKKAKPSTASARAWVAVYDTYSLSTFPESVRSKIENNAIGRGRPRCRPQPRERPRRDP